jgi:plasmid stabilization system protein ParE
VIAKSVVYTNRAIQNALVIRNYLKFYFSIKEVASFYELIQSFEKVIINFPKLYHKPNRKLNVRRAVMSKQLSIYYRINKEVIEVIAILDNRCDMESKLDTSTI